MTLKQRTIRFKPGVKMNYSSLLRSRWRPLCVVAREAGEKEKAESARDSIIAMRADKGWAMKRARPSKKV